MTLSDKPDIRNIVRWCISEAAKQLGEDDGPFNKKVSILIDPEDNLADDAFSGYLAGMIKAQFAALLSQVERDSSLKISVYQEKLRKIHDRATRRLRGTTDNKYLMWDLEEIEELSKLQSLEPGRE